jgi:hypothetical protein
VGPTATYTLPVVSVSPYSITTVVSQGLQAREYQVVVVNGNQPGGAAVSNPGTFALYDPAGACFYDFFESGTGKWTTGGDWGIVILPSGERAITDSPLGPYKNAGDYGSGVMSYATTITSLSFSLAECTNPVLTFQHDYVIAKVGDSQDVARVALSTDNGVTWRNLISYTGGGVFGTDISGQDVSSPEWANVDWHDVEISLGAYTGTVQLRLSLTVDEGATDKGWVIDNLLVLSDPNPAPPASPVYLPVVFKEE